MKKKSTSFDPERYHVTVAKILEDGEILYRATVLELPDLAVYGVSHDEAYGEAIIGIGDLHDAAGRLGKSFPDPAAEAGQQYTGRVTLRLPSTLHERAANCAGFDGVSLNLWLVSAIAQVVGERRSATATESNDEPPPPPRKAKARSRRTRRPLAKQSA